MLAQNFMTPADLGITDILFESLVKVLGMLERGELKHTPVTMPIPNGFNMADRWIHDDCGTACCIMGWCDLVARKQLSWPISNHALADLFCPDMCWAGHHTPAQAAIALRNYLTHGEPRWAEALAE